MGKPAKSRPLVVQREDGTWYSQRRVCSTVSVNGALKGVHGPDSASQKVISDLETETVIDKVMDKGRKLAEALKANNAPGE